MIPLKIQLKNFLSYGSEIQTIDFVPYQLICLSGKNGHGKSALLDAITWAIWGQARKTCATIKADQGLLRLGQTQMMVILDFESNGKVYRIKREYMKTYGKPVAILEFGLLDPTTNNLIPLTDKTIRKTQKKIIENVHLDFDSFVNSAFLRQGNANEFSQKSPKERKEILASILGLSQYETLKKLAGEKARQAVAQKKIIEALQEKISNELKQTAEISAKHKQLKADLEEIKKDEAKVYEQLKNFDNRLESLQKKHNESEILQAHYKQVNKLLDQQQKQLESIQKEFTTVEAQQKKMPHQKTIENNKAALILQLQEQQTNLHKRLVLKEKYLKTKEKAHHRNKEVNKKWLEQLNSIKVEIERLKSTIGHIGLQKKSLSEQQKKLTSDQEKRTKELEALKKEQKNYIQVKKVAEKAEQQFEKRRTAYQQYVAQANLTKKELEQLKQKKELVHDDLNPSCPLCEQNLSASRRKFLKKKFDTQQHYLKHRFVRYSKVVPKLKSILLQQHEEIKKNKQQLQDFLLAQAKIEDLTSVLNNDTQALIKLARQVSALDNDEKKMRKSFLKSTNELEAYKRQEKNILAQDSTLKELVTELKNIENNIQILVYDQKKHQELQKKIQECEAELKKYEQLSHQITLQKKRKNEIESLTASIEKFNKEIQVIKQKLAQFQSIEGDREKIVTQKNKATHQLKELLKKKEGLLQQHGSLENQKKKLHLLEKEYKSHQKELKSLTETVGDYQAIANATSKDGIQALLIEQAIPEIEQQANELLAKLTDNQAHITIESLRDLKKGGTKETLDIKISDPAGIRPYELFSGGEAFRIDFALRIAISKLLAHRAGTSLQTLIIDEGFGSQDEEGLNRIMEAIYKIQDDFLKVIVVSHLPTLKDQFPVHFVIKKGPNGSMVTVSEHG